ncbi:hypothetical protein BH18ACT12_BH18ACT12_01200 [soil metagenome]
MRRTMLKMSGAVSLTALGLLAASWVGGASAQQPPAPPGQGPCSHGNTGKECKPDPQPEHGKDCDEHGPYEGGVNEDHCLGQTTTTVETTTTTKTTTNQTTTTNLTTTTNQTKTDGTTTTTPNSISTSGGVLGNPTVTKAAKAPVKKPKRSERAAAVPGHSASNPQELAFTP